MLCMLSIACPNVLIDETFFPEFHSDLIWIRTLTTFFSSFLRERIQISQKAGHHRPARETPCYTFVIFQVGGSEPPVPPSGSAHGTGLCLHLLRYTETHFILLIGLCTTLCVLSTDRQVERERCVFFLNFVIFLTQRARLRISKIRVYLCKKFFLKEERKCSDSSVV